MMTTENAATAETAAAVAEQGAHVAPEKASSKKGASKSKGAPKGVGCRASRTSLRRQCLLQRIRLLLIPGIPRSVGHMLCGRRLLYLRSRRHHPALGNS